MESNRQLREHAAETVCLEKRPDVRHLEEIRVQLYCVTVFSHYIDTIHFDITCCTFNENTAVDPCEMPVLLQEDTSHPHPGFALNLKAPPACSKTAGAHRDQGRGRTGLERSLGPPRSGQTPCLLRAEGRAALLCLLPAGGHSHSGHEHKQEVQNPILLH